MSTGKRISELRTLTGMSQEELAGRLFVDRSLVSKWENGSRRPDRESVAKMAAIFGVSPDRIVEKDEEIMRELASCIPEGTDTADASLPAVLDAFLATLGERGRLIFVRRYHYLDRPREISDLLGISGGSVRVTLWKVRLKLKEYLSERSKK